MTRLLCLVAVLLATSGFTFRCFVFCNETTGIQADYTAQRDDCRDYAQTKLETLIEKPGAPPLEEKERKAKLVSLFSECMGKNGWTVPDGKPAEKEKTAAAAVTPAPAAAPAPATSVATQPATATAAPVMAVTVTPTPQNLAAPATPPTAPAPKPEMSAETRRSAQCGFARYAASSSSNAAKTAEECDIECAEALKKQSGGPLPAACPGE